MGYQVRIRIEGEEYGPWIDVEDLTTYQFTDLLPNTAYCVQTRSYCAPGNESDLSNEYCFTTDAFSPETQAFFDCTNISDIPQQTIVQNLVVGMQSIGVWDKCVAIYPFIGGTADTHKCNLKDPSLYEITWFGNILHDANGITPDGLTGYGDTGLLADSLPLNDLHIGVYSRTDSDNTGKELGYSNNTTTQATQLQLRTGNTWYSYIHDHNFYSRVFIPNNDSLGLHLATRRSDVDMEVFKDGVSVGTQTSNGARSLPAESFFISAINAFWVPEAQQHSNRNLGFITIGYSLTSTEVADYYTVIQDFETALSRQV